MKWSLLAIRNKGTWYWLYLLSLLYTVSLDCLCGLKMVQVEKLWIQQLCLCVEVAQFLDQRDCGLRFHRSENRALHTKGSKHVCAVLTELIYMRWCCWEAIVFISINDSALLFSHSYYKHELDHEVIWHSQWDFFQMRFSMENDFSVERKHLSQALGQLSWWHVIV